MASFQKRCGKWRALIRKSGHCLSRTFTLKKDAEQWAREQELAIERGIFHHQAPQTLQRLIEEHIELALPQKKGQRKERLMLQAFQRHFPHLCAKKAADFNKHDVVAWRDKRLQEVSSSSVSREWHVLSHVYSYAIRTRGLNLPRNPFRDVTAPAAAPPRSRRISPQEVLDLKEKARYEALTPPQNGQQWALWAFLFALESACRLGEICKLQDFDIQEDLIHLRDTKNGDDRHVPLSAEAKRLLSLVELPVPYRASYLSAAFARLSGELDDLRFHDSRHEALSRMAKKIGNPMTLAKISGHKDLKVLLNVYYNPNGEDLKGLL